MTTEGFTAAGPELGQPARKISGLRAIHSSGRYDRPLDVLDAALESYAAQASVITLTEQDGRDQARERVYDGTGLSWVRFARRGAGECAVLWNGRHLLNGSPVAHRLTSRTYWRVTGKRAAPFYSVTVPLRDTVTDVLRLYSVAHLPTRSTALRRAVWDAALTGWVRHVHDLAAGRYAGAEVLMRADWNKDLRDVATRVALDRRLERVAHGGRLVVPTGGGTHGRRVIDADWSTTPATSHVIADDASSDHRPYLTTLEDQ